MLCIQLALKATIKKLQGLYSLFPFSLARALVAGAIFFSANERFYFKPPRGKVGLENCAALLTARVVLCARMINFLNGDGGTYIFSTGDNCGILCFAYSLALSPNNTLNHMIQACIYVRAASGFYIKKNFSVIQYCYLILFVVLKICTLRIAGCSQKKCKQ